MFGTKEALVLELVHHWLDRETIDFDAMLMAQECPDRLKAHIEQTQRLDMESHGKLAALLAVAAHSPQHRQIATAWYRDRSNDMVAETPSERRRRLAFLATEGVYFLRFLVGLPIDDPVWRDVFADIAWLSQIDDNGNASSHQPKP